jgi:hypothetical protein
MKKPKLRNQPFEKNVVLISEAFRTNPQTPQTSTNTYLCGGESFGVLLDVVGDGTVGPEELDVGTVRLNLTSSTLL